MSAEKKGITTLLRRFEAKGGVRLRVVDYAFLVLRFLIVVGGALWLIFNPNADVDRQWLAVLFLAFIAYSVAIYAAVFSRPALIDVLYRACFGLDLVFTGIAINFSGGFHSPLFTLFYPMVALHAFYYGFYSGMAVAVLSSAVYFFSVQNLWHGGHWTDLMVRISIIFLVAGFLGFISEKEKEEQNELLNTKDMLKRLRNDLDDTYRHLTELKKQAGQAEKLASLGKLSAELAHEINNPLDGIKNCLTTLKDESSSKEMKSKYLSLMEEAIMNIETAMRDFLDYAKTHETRLGDMVVSETLARAVALAEYKIQKMGIALEARFDPSAKPVKGDTYQIQEVFFNVIINAIDAMPGGGRLTVETRGREGFVEVAITDTGKGIPEKDIERIFEPFYTTKPEGTGLGLAVSQEIITRHGGSISVKSREGGGSTFYITLPCPGEEAAA